MNCPLGRDPDRQEEKGEARPASGEAAADQGTARAISVRDGATAKPYGPAY
jgi:hypothetical protein